MNWTIKDCPKATQFFLEKLKDVQLLDTLAIIDIFINVVLALTATLGNGLIVVAILRSQNLQTPSYLLITSLAFTDLLVGLVFDPLQITLSTYFLQGNDQGVCVLSTAYMFFTACLGLSSLFMVTCISIDRYLALTLRHRYTIIVTKKRVRLLTVVVWIVSSLLSLLTIIEKLFSTVIIIYSSLSLLMLSITCVCYIKSFRALRLYTLQVHAQQANPLSGNFDVVRYKKTLKTMLLVLTCLLLCHVPLICALGLWKIAGVDMNTPLLHFLSLALAGLNSSINPITYLIRFTDIRNACRKILNILDPVN